MNKADAPCIKNKCISYPICINKPIIDCEDIKQYLRESIAEKYDTKDVFNILRELFPNAVRVTTSQTGGFVMDYVEKPVAVYKQMLPGMYHDSTM